MNIKDFLREDAKLKETMVDSALNMCRRIKQYNIKSGQPHYLLKNMIRSYTSYDTEYLITKETKKVLENLGYDFNKFQRRSNIHKLKDDNGNRLLTFEHMIPAIVLQNILLNSPEDIDSFKKVLDKNRVTIMLKTQDKLLTEAGLRSKLPIDDLDMAEERYKVCNIELSDVVVKTYGDMKI